MRSLIRHPLFLALILTFSCDKMPLFVNCSDCTKEEPETASVEIKIDDLVLDDVSGAVVNIYSGNLEDNVLIDSFTTSKTHITYTATINNKYTFTATYYMNGVRYIAMDAIIPKVKYDKSQCTDPCYFVYDKKVNLKLKYTGILKTEDKRANNNNYLTCN
jgi:hypothetical protein